jgi:tRNA (guanine9-N1)-methyltransferase
MEKRSEERERKIERLTRARELGQKIVVDLDFAHLMTPSEIHSLVQQVFFFLKCLYFYSLELLLL